MIREMLKRAEELRTADYSAGYMEALHDVEQKFLQCARDNYERGFEEGRSGSALAPFVFLILGMLAGFALGAWIC